MDARNSVNMALLPILGLAVVLVLIFWCFQQGGALCVG